MSFTYKGSTISARELTIGEELDIGTIAMAITGTSEWKMAHTWFAQYQLAAEVTGDEPISRIAVGDDPAKIKTAFAEWLKLPGSFSRRWNDEMIKVDQAAKNV